MFGRFGPSPGSAERRRQKERKDRDRDRDTDKDKDGDKKEKRPSQSRKVSSSSTKERKTRDRDADTPSRERRKRDTSPNSKSPSSSKMSSLVPEMERKPSGSSPGGSKYPTFSKAHSKETIGSRENIVNPRMSLFTPDPTDVDGDETTKKDEAATTTAGAAPPSPPLTAADDPDLRRAKSGSSMRRTPEKLKVDTSRSASLEGIIPRLATKRSSSASTMRKERSSTPKKKGDASDRAKAFAEIRPGKKHTVVEDTNSDTTAHAKSIGISSTPAPRTAEFSIVTEATSQSSATSIQPPKRSAPPPPPPITLKARDGSSPTSAEDSSPRTPTPHDPVFPRAVKHTPIIEVFANADDAYPSPYSIDGSAPVSAGLSSAAPPPPPPPPRPQSVEVPRVDYLLQNGGLSHIAHRKFLSALGPAAAAYGFQGNGASAFVPGQAQQIVMEQLFAPFSGVLDDYTKVMEKHGSLAVATGYRSVARRLLDRLEAVFNRNISSETCDCLMCKMNPPSLQFSEDETGVSWGEILEFVSGRRELPSWPPFAISSETLESTPNLDAPFQKIDIDVPEEYRDHYVKQGKRTKEVVQAWLASQPELPSSPPQEVDDETLIFAMVTHLEPENRRLFTALLRGAQTLPASRAPTPLNVAKPELMSKSALALQRLYRLSTLPRDPECAMYLLKNAEVHSVLATLSAISAGEWDILTSGRFDGFLWSGADSHPPSRGPSRGPTPVTPASALRTPLSAFGPFGMSGLGTPSRNGTPWSPGNGVPPTPGSATTRFGAPVQMDEETEIATLAEIEREIYTGMEALEDAFELLHARAETVRSMLRSRGAGLSLAASARRGPSAADPIATVGTPGIGPGMWAAGLERVGAMYGAHDEDWDGARSELAPDDSASNISSKRRRKRRDRDREKERQTPAPVEEEDEEGSVIAIEVKDKKGGSMRRR